ncbi:hypothetical protein CSA56_00945 [candidate division KSB3 bacterium]|uniref:NADP-dependent oxidoreductase domain-containing protein n=1 Tax=candidate division KSB3 bacterium TaxID=2044937 RepID=A0A2G6KKQ4_9BACT|nr:MAG: hypothetical protein CSA56_00945 [candidate division KSB3 bacterium]
MELRSCGTSGLELSALGLGCWAFGGGDYWGESDQENVTKLIHCAVEGGMNYFDTAEMYNDGRSEEFLGKAIKGIPRDQLMIGTKIWPTYLYSDTLVEHCEASLKRLGTDYMDIYMIHWPIGPRTVGSDDKEAQGGLPSLEKAVALLQKLQQQGKVRHVGVSNFGVSKFDEILEYGGEYAVNQLIYNPLTRAAEMEILPYCQQHGVGVIAYMVLLQSLLTDRYSSFDEIPEQYARIRHFSSKRTSLCRHGEEGAEVETMQTLTDIRTIAKECGMSTAALALKWTVANPAITCTLVGTQSISRLEMNLKAVEEPLPPDVVERVNVATAALKEKLGPSLDVFESVENDRTR